MCGSKSKSIQRQVCSGSKRPIPTTKRSLQYRITASMLVLIEQNCNIFAVKSSKMTVVKIKTKEDVSLLQNDLNNVAIWAREWQLSLNFEKKKSVLFIWYVTRFEHDYHLNECGSYVWFGYRRANCPHMERHMKMLTYFGVFVCTVPIAAFSKGSDRLPLIILNRI